MNRQATDLKKCRLCLCNENVLIYLYKANGVLTNVAKTISEVLNYQVSKTDGFPPYICTSCADKLWEFKAFKVKCEVVRKAFEILLRERDQRSINPDESSFMNDIVLKKELVLKQSPASPSKEDAVERELEGAKGGFKVFVESILVGQNETETANSTAKKLPKTVRRKKRKRITLRRRKKAKIQEKDEVEELQGTTGDFQVFAESVSVDKGGSGRSEDVENLPKEAVNDYGKSPNHKRRKEIKMEEKDAVEELVETAGDFQVRNCPMHVKEEYGIAFSDDENQICPSPVKMEIVENDIHSIDQDSFRDAATNDNNARIVTDHTESSFSEEPMMHPVGEVNTQVLGCILQPVGDRSNQFSRSEPENSQTDQLNYVGTPDKITNSGVQEPAIESDVYCNSATIVQVGESLSRYSLMEDSKPLASTSRIGRVMDGLSISGCLSDYVRETAARERNLKYVTGAKVQVGGCLSRHSLMGDAKPLSSESTNGVIGGGISKASSAEGCLSVESVEADVSEEENETYPLWSGNQKCKSLICGQCGKEFKRRYSLNQHIKGVHSSGKLDKCKICKEAFKDRNHLFNHSLSHRETPRFRCSECGKCFQVKWYFTEHLRRHGVKLFPCVHCGVEFGNKLKLEDHYTVHDGEVDWNCDYCSDKYHIWSDLVSHRTTHKVKMGFRCDICGAEYRIKKSLVRHIYGHIRPYSCPTCNKAFPARSDLLRHSYTHSEIKPHECHICSKRFSDKGNVIKHLKTHSEDRPFSCKFCSYRAKTENGLKMHDHKHSNSRQYKCSICDRTYTTNFQKCRHERKLHKDNLAK